MQKFHGKNIRRRAASLEKTLFGTSFSSSMHMVHGWPPSWLGGLTVSKSIPHSMRIPCPCLYHVFGCDKLHFPCHMVYIPLRISQWILGAAIPICIKNV